MAAVHEFALLEHAPLHGVRYDTYEAPQMRCVSVHDDDIERYLDRFTSLTCYAHTVDIPCRGLCYCGITLVSPQTAREMRHLVDGDPAFDALTAMLSDAVNENKWIIHFGI